MKYINSTNITDVKLLKKVIEMKGVRTLWLCETAQVNYYNLRRGLEGVRPFTVPEAYGISKALGLSASERDKIFFAHDVLNIEQDAEGVI